MKAKNSKVIISFITSLILLSSISVLAPIIINYDSDTNKNSIILSSINNHPARKISNSNYSEVADTLINNLTYINKYINLTLIIKEKRLRLSILGGKYDKSARYKNDKNKKRSQLAQFSHYMKHVHRYGDQVRATIDNSASSLADESSNISKIIPIIKDHPYTYNSYLNNMKVVIPNIGFFINKNNLSSTNNLNSKGSNISITSYLIGTNNTNLNSISFCSEEDVASAQTLYSNGSSVWKAAFKKITFKAQIITFNKNTNSFEYETPTAVENTTSKTSISAQVDLENTEISNANSFKANNLSYFNSSKEELSSINSSNNTFIHNLPIPLIPNYLPGYFNQQLSNASEAKVKYNQINSFNNNKTLYYPLIFSPFLIVGIAVGSIISVLKYRKLKIQRRNAKDLNLRIDKLKEDIKNPPITIEHDEQFTAYTNDTRDRISSIRQDSINNLLKNSERKRISARVDNASKEYNNNTIGRRKQLLNANEKVIEPIYINPTSSPVDSPIPSPVDSPIPSPVDSPIPSPVDSPIPSPVDSPIPSPVDSPIPSPVDSPIPSPVDSPIPSPVDSPIPSPVDSPIPSPADSPIPSPVNSPIPSPINTPIPFPINSPLRPRVHFTSDEDLPTELQIINKENIEKLIESYGVNYDNIRKYIGNIRNKKDLDEYTQQHKLILESILLDLNTNNYVHGDDEDILKHKVQAVIDNIDVRYTARENVINEEESRIAINASRQKVAENDMHLNDPIKFINEKFAFLEEHISKANVAGCIDSISYLNYFIRKMQDEIEIIVISAKANSEIIGERLLAQYDAKVRNLRISIEQLYESTINKAKVYYDHIKVELENNQWKLTILNKGIADQEIKESGEQWEQSKIKRIKDKICSLEWYISEGQKDIERTPELANITRKFRFPDTVINILEHA